MRIKACFFLLLLGLLCAVPRGVRAQMDPYFTAINYPVPKGMLMVMPLVDYQSARVGPNFYTGMIMAQYGITPRWTAGMMVDGQKINGQPLTYGGLRFNTYYQLFPHDNLLHFTLYGEYEDLNAADIYKMEVSGFGGEDLTQPLALAKRTPAHTFEQRAIIYHDWGPVDATFNFVSEYALDGSGNSFGYAWGIFKQPQYMGMQMGMGMNGDMNMSPGPRTRSAGTKAMPPMKGMPAVKSAPGANTMPGMKGMSPMNETSGATSMPETHAMNDMKPPLLSMKRLGYGVEMMGALGNTQQFGFYWNRQQQYLGPVLVYVASPRVSLRVEPTFGLSNVSDPFVLRTGISYSFGGLGR